MEAALFIALFTAVVAWTTAPVWRRRSTGAIAADLSALEAERDARLAAVRDAELDLRTGKLSEPDHRALAAQLRAEAVEAMDRLEWAREERA